MKLFIYYKKFNIEKIHAYDFYSIKDKSNSRKLLEVFKAFISSIFKKYKPSLKKVNTIFLLMNSIFRLDHKYLFDSIYDLCTYDKEKMMINIEKKINFYNLSHFFLHLNICHRITKKYGFLNGIFIYIKLITYFQFFNTLKLMEFKNLVVFSDIQPIENIFVHYSNFIDKTTVTMQHGLYIDYKDKPNINMINYLYSSSKYLLAWGESTKRLFKNYNQNILVEITGKPTILKNDNILKNDKLIGVVFDQPMFKRYNIKMLSIAYEIAVKFNMKVVLRLHPHDDKKYYRLENDLTINGSNIDRVDYILAHITSMIYEYLALGYKVFKLKSEVPANEINEYLKFSNSEDLLDKFDLRFDFQKEALDHISFIGDDSKALYRKFFDKIYDSKTIEYYDTIGVTNEN